MARYISQYSAFKKTVRKGEQTLVQGPQGPIISTLREPIIAQFQHANVTPWELEVAAERWGKIFLGVAEGEQPLRRVSGYDTDEQAERLAWTKEEKEAIERLLDAQQGADYLRVERPVMAPPWPSYNDLDDAEQIVLVAQATGIDINAVMAYEIEHENRVDVVAALEAAKGEAPEPDEDTEPLIAA